MCYDTSFPVTSSEESLSVCPELNSEMTDPKVIKLGKVCPKNAAWVRTL